MQPPSFSDFYRWVADSDETTVLGMSGAGYINSPQEWWLFDTTGSSQNDFIIYNYGHKGFATIYSPSWMRAFSEKLNQAFPASQYVTREELLAVLNSMLGGSAQHVH